ncbi:signal peptidase II [Aestuariimicrobium ganziense]|uniref:signal peptidase II n=1 Tax=Aestuariimicrobium ganziense TaxID=2773677 RepID=UPI00194341C2|nr:signal peptidase II [Aestuariimicrobium ganziense]
MPRHRAARVLIAGLAVVLLAIDQATKAWAVATLDPSDPPSYLGGFLTLRLVRNPGAAFSLGSSATWLFSLLAIAALTYCLFVLAPRITSRGGAVVTGLAIAGIAGNLIDRIVRPPGVMRGHVIDFLQIPHWAIFNVADMCIVATAILVVLGAIREAVVERRQKQAAATP